MTASAAAPAAPAAPGAQATPDAPAATPPASGAPAVAPTVVPPGATVAGTPSAGENLSDVDKVEKLPLWAQKIISDARSGEAAQRTAAKEAADRTKAILKAAGLEPDEADPAKITADLEAERSTSRQRAVELAVFRAASSAGADPDALLDSRGFLDKVKDLDPSDGQGIRLAIADAIQNNPRLKAQAAEPATAQPAPSAPAAGVSGADFAGGTGAAAQQLTRDQLAAMSPEDILKAHKDGRLSAVMGAK